MAGCKEVGHWFDADVEPVNMPRFERLGCRVRVNGFHFSRALRSSARCDARSQPRRNDFSRRIHIARTVRVRLRCLIGKFDEEVRVGSRRLAVEYEFDWARRFRGRLPAASSSRLTRAAPDRTPARRDRGRSRRRRKRSPDSDRRTCRSAYRSGVACWGAVVQRGHAARRSPLKYHVSYCTVGGGHAAALRIAFEPRTAYSISGRSA